MRTFALAALVACGHPAPPVENRALPTAGLAGRYRCALLNPDMLTELCVIERVGDRLEVSKRTGPQTFRGVLAADGAFAGELSCSPLVDCRARLAGQFHSGPAGTLIGDLVQDAMPAGECRERCGGARSYSVTLQPAPTSYGGDGYGGPTGSTRPGAVP